MENLVKLYEYELDRMIVNKCIEQDKKITNEDVKNEIHKILEDNKIEYKNKIKEEWTGGSKRPKYNLFVEIFVDETDYKTAKLLLEEYLK